MLETLAHFGLKIAGFEKHRALPVPDRWAIALEIIGNSVLRKARVPGVGEDHRPEKPEAAFMVDVQSGVAVGEPGRVGQEKWLAPLPGTFFEPHPINGHIVRLSFSGASIPGNQQIPIRALDDPRRMIVLRMQRKDEFRFAGRCGARLAPGFPRRGNSGSSLA